MQRNVPDWAGNTPVFAAITCHAHVVLELLLREGVDLTHQNKTGGTVATLRCKVWRQAHGRDHRVGCGAQGFRSFCTGLARKKSEGGSSGSDCSS